VLTGLFTTPSHRAASAAKEKGSGGPVRRRRENGTLSAIFPVWVILNSYVAYFGSVGV